MCKILNLNQKDLPPKEFISRQIIDLLTRVITSLYPNLKLQTVNIHIEHPADLSNGDFSTNIAMGLAKNLKKSPLAIAEELSKKINENLPNYLQITKTANPGFINFWLNNKALLNTVETIIKDKKTFGSIKANSKKKIMIEFTDPNPFKEFHIGHLYSNAVGESISRLLEASGADLKRVNYQGDVGMHVAKSIWGLIKKLRDEKISLNLLEGKSLVEKVKFLGQAYALGAEAYENQKEASEEMKDINYLVFVSAQNFLKEKYRWQPQVDYQQYISGKKYKLEQIEILYKNGREWSLAYFETIYKRLGTKFNYYYFESIVGEYGLKIIKEYLDKGVFEKHDGAVIFRGEKYGLHTRVFINQLGLPTYEAKELGLAPTKYKDFPYDLSIIVTANEINEYFNVLIQALSLVNPPLATKTLHIGHGVVRLPEGKMSSRTGNILTGEWLLDEIKKKVLEILRNSSSLKIKKNKIESTSEQITIGAVKYALLKANIGHDIIFNIEQSLNLQGNSGPYLQYTYARTKSILSKAKTLVPPAPATTTFPTGEDLCRIQFVSEELAILRLLYRFPEVVLLAAQNYSPNIICTYLYEIAQKFNSFYDKLPILKAAGGNRIIRLKITTATSQVIENGLRLLGIEAPEKM
jgi:arginyl-tRNA synthetase